MQKKKHKNNCTHFKPGMSNKLVMPVQLMSSLGLRMKNMVMAPTRGTSPIRGSKITLNFPCS